MNKYPTQSNYHYCKETQGWRTRWTRQQLLSHWGVNELITVDDLFCKKPFNLFWTLSDKGIKGQRLPLP